jgi:hypothetical protein
VVIAILLAMVSVVICERVAPEMLHQALGTAAAHWSINDGYDQETTSERREDVLSWQKPETNRFPYAADEARPCA